VYAGPVTVTVLIPAHNEESCIDETIRSIRSQSHAPERIIVVADNCTDGTATIARTAGVEVFATRGNTQKKAGALNQALAVTLPEQRDNDLVMVMDADTTLDDGFLEAAVQRMADDRALMAVGGLFYGEEGKGLLGQFQRNEYTRYAREIGRRRGRVFVLTGTASIFRPRALRTVAAERGRTIPGVHGDVYDTLVLTEDNELTLAIKSLGGLMISPQRCTVVTEVMQTWRALWAQRLRWQRGAVENLGSYGLRPAVMRYWAQQLGIGYGVIAIAAFLLLTVVMVLALDEWVWFPFWIAVGCAFVLETGDNRVAGRLACPAARGHAVPGVDVRHVLEPGLCQGNPRHRSPATGRLEADRATAGDQDRRRRMMPLPVPLGVLIPQAFLGSTLFQFFSAFVALNTIMYVTLAIAKILPKFYLSDWVHRRGRRSETRSIHPDDGMVV